MPHAKTKLKGTGVIKDRVWGNQTPAIGGNVRPKELRSSGGRSQ